MSPTHRLAGTIRGSVADRQLALELLRRPLTIRQLALKLDLDPDSAGARMRVLRQRGEVLCLNPRKRSGRVYVRADRARLDYDQIGRIYGWASSRHRSAVIKALGSPGRAVEIRRRARYLDPELRMGVSSVRDVLRLMVRRRLVSVTFFRRRKHTFPVFALTELGQRIQLLMLTGDARSEPAHDSKPTQPRTQPSHLGTPPDREGGEKNRRRDSP